MMFLPDMLCGLCGLLVQVGTCLVHALGIVTALGLRRVGCIAVNIQHDIHFLSLCRDTRMGVVAELVAAL